VIPENGLPVGTYVCRVVQLEASGYSRCVLHLAIAHGPHAGRVAKVVTRYGTSWLPEPLLDKWSEGEDEWGEGEMDSGKILSAIGPTFAQLVRVAVPPGKPLPHCTLIARASTFPCRGGNLPPNQLDTLARAALGADRLLSFEETQARYRALAADELAAVFGSTVARSAKR